MRSQVQMSLAGTWRWFQRVRVHLFQYRYRAEFHENIALALGFAALTGLAAQIRVPLPFTPVPITLQTFAVLLAGVVLGMRFGGLSQAFYVVIGAAGMPWFQGFGAGLGHILGPTGGYLIGFVLAAIAIGYVIDRFPITRRFPALLVTLLLANFVIIYLIALPWLYLWIALVSGAAVTLPDVLTMGLIPFIPGDIVKVIAAAAVGTAIIPGDSPQIDARS